jgi:hypothetical protein
MACYKSWLNLKFHLVFCSTNLWPKIQNSSWPKNKRSYIIEQGQDFTQHEFDDMKISNQEISFQMQGMFNQNLY